MAYETPTGRACDEGCCVTGRDPDIRPDQRATVGAVRSMMSVIDDINGCRNHERPDGFHNPNCPSLWGRVSVRFGYSREFADAWVRQVERRTFELLRREAVRV